MHVFIIGAAGYIGGSVASALIARGHKVSGLTRDPATAEKLEARGIDPIMGTNTDVAPLHRAAAVADVVINAADVENPYPVATVLAALKGSGKRFIQTSGTSVVGDKSGGEYSHKIYHEDTPLDALPEKVVRTAIHRQVLAAAHDNVQSIVLCPSLIYGKGTGLNPDSVQIPRIIKHAQKHGVVRYIGKGEHVWSTCTSTTWSIVICWRWRKPPPGPFFTLRTAKRIFYRSRHALANCSA